MGARDLVGTYCTYNAYRARSLRLQKYQRSELRFDGRRLKVRVFNLDVTNELTPRHSLFDPDDRTLVSPITLDDKFNEAFLGGYASLSATVEDVRYLLHQRTIPKRNRRRGG